MQGGDLWSTTKLIVKMEASEPATRHLSIGDELIRWSTRKRALGVDFDHRKNVIFVHGFTSHGSYMGDLIQYFDDSIAVFATQLKRCSNFSTTLICSRCNKEKPRVVCLP
jgi:hypothetical protein